MQSLQFTNQSDLLVVFPGVMQATTMGGTKLEKRYSPSFRDDPGRKTAASKRKREEVLR